MNVTAMLPNPGTQHASVGVVIVNYNSSELVIECVRSIQSACVSEIVIWDNSNVGRVDSSLLDLERSDERVRLHTADRNLGYGAGINAGIDMLESDFAQPVTHVLVLNPDTRLEPDAIDALMLATRAAPSIFLASPSITFGASEPFLTWFYGGSIDWLEGTVSHHHYGEVFDREARDFTDKLIPTGFVPGTAMFAPIDFWKQNKFNENLFLYWEDVDLCLRCERQNIPIYLVPKSVIHHDEGATSRTDEGHSSIYYYYMNKNRIVVCAERLGGLPIAYQWWLQTFKSILAPLKNEPHEKLSRTIAAGRGVWNGLQMTRLAHQDSDTSIVRGADWRTSQDPVETTAMRITSAIRAGVGLKVTWLNHASIQTADWKSLASFDFVGVDGTFLQLLLKSMGIRIKRTSADLVLPRCFKSAPSAVRAVLVGSKPGIARQAASRLDGVIATYDGYAELRSLRESAYEALEADEPNLVVVGLGAGLQDAVAAEIASRLPTAVVATAGGWLDQTAHRESYFPPVVHRLRLGWLWRLLHEPKRLLGRYTLGALRAIASRRRYESQIRDLAGGSGRVQTVSNARPEGVNVAVRPSN